MQDATTSDSEREISLILMSSSAAGALMALVRMGTAELAAGAREAADYCLLFRICMLNSMSKRVGSEADSTPGLPGGGWAADLNGAMMCSRCRS